MSANIDPQSYLMAAGGLAFVAAGITYCAVNWDDPPEWWPNSLQPWWNKKDSETVQTDQFVKHVDETEQPNVDVTDSVINNENTSKQQKQQEQQQEENTESEVAALKENLVKTENIEIELTQNK